MLAFLLSLRGAELAVQSWIVSGHSCHDSCGNKEEYFYYDGLPLVLVWKVLQGCAAAQNPKIDRAGGEQLEK